MLDNIESRKIWAVIINCILLISRSSLFSETWSHYCSTILSTFTFYQMQLLLRFTEKWHQNIQLDSNWHWSQPHGILQTANAWGVIHIIKYAWINKFHRSNREFTPHGPKAATLALISEPQNPKTTPEKKLGDHPRLPDRAPSPHHWGRPHASHIHIRPLCSCQGGDSSSIFIPSWFLSAVFWRSCCNHVV